MPRQEPTTRALAHLVLGGVWLLLEAQPTEAGAHLDGVLRLDLLLGDLVIADAGAHQRPLDGIACGEALRLRERGRPAESVTLPRPLTWDEVHHRDAIRWIERLYRVWNDGSLTLKAALKEISGQSDKTGADHTLTWEQIADALEASRVQQSEKCSADTFQKNWRPFIDHAVKLINTGKVHDGYSLLKTEATQFS